MPCSVAENIYRELFNADFHSWSADSDVPEAPLAHFTIDDPAIKEGREVYCLVGLDGNSVNCSSGLAGISKVYLSVSSDSATTPIGERLPVNHHEPAPHPGNSDK